MYQYSPFLQSLIADLRLKCDVSTQRMGRGSWMDFHAKSKSTHSGDAFRSF